MSGSFWQKPLTIKLIILMIFVNLFLLLLGYFIGFYTPNALWILILTGILLGVILGVGFGYFIFRPLFHIQQKLNTFTKDFSSPEQYLTLPRYITDMNNIVIKINELLRKLGDFFRQIKAHEALVEFRIEERTKELAKMANYDIVTELPNRNLLKENLSQLITESEKEKKIASLFIIELLDFHDITNAFGHNIGNLLLKEMGHYLTDNLPSQTVIAHISTTQFALIRDKIHNTSQINSLAQWILDLFIKPLRIANHNICTTINMGIAVFPTDGENAETLMVNANLALNRAKKNIPNSFQFYEPSMNTALETRRTTLVDLHYALEQNQLKVFYQPQILLSDQKLVGAEALVRWEHPEKGLITPIHFIPLAEESGLIIALGDFVLKTVCQQIKTWEYSGFPSITLAVNLSSIQFRQKGFIDRIKHLLNEFKISPEQLTLEVTESTIMEDIESAIITMKALRGLGLSLALDDFGTGYSSLNYVKRFPLQKIKIDQAFVREIDLNPEGKHIVDIIIQLGKTMDMRTIAEGIETPTQAQYLTERGCDEGQGYLYGRPMQVSKFEELFIPNSFKK